MSRWNKTTSNRFQTVMPLDNLLKGEKENKNSVAIGTVMKWGDCKFTSIRSSCYSKRNLPKHWVEKLLRFFSFILDMGALSSTSPIQNSAESPTGQNELNDNKITVEQVPKPRKFFKSRNTAPSAEIQQQMAMQQSSYQQSYQNHQPVQQDHNLNASGGDDEDQVLKKTVRKKKIVAKKIEKPPKPEKIPKPKKEKKVKEVKVKEVVAAVSEDEASEPETPSPTRRGRSNAEATRSSGRARAKCVNYNEDAGEDEFFNRIERRVVPRHLVPATVTSNNENSPTAPPPVPETVPAPQQSPSLHPPIVLRISKVDFSYLWLWCTCWKLVGN